MDFSCFQSVRIPVYHYVTVNWKEQLKAALVGRSLKWSKLCQNYWYRSAASLQDSFGTGTHKEAGILRSVLMGWPQEAVSYYWYCLQVLANSNNKHTAFWSFFFFTVFKFSTDNIPFYYLHLGCTSLITLALVCHCFEAQKSFFFFFVSYLLYYNYRSLFFKEPNRNTFSNERIATKSLEIKEV